MTIEPTEFRRILGHWATGVAVIAARAQDGTPAGLSANAVASLSLYPPLVLVCIDQNADSHGRFEMANGFSINVLAAEDEAIARRFAMSDGPRKFDGIAWREGTTGAPVLEQALAWVDCRMHAQYPGGDHTIFIGEVVAGGAREAGPLLFYRGGFGRFSS